MSLRAIAEADLATTLESETCGFGWPITITNPAGLALPFVGSSTDISQLIDPDTGQTVSGRLASVTVRMSSLVTAGFAGLPRGIADSTIKPWLVSFDDIGGAAHTFKVAESNPDRTIGVVTLNLEAYTP